MQRGDQGLATQHHGFKTGWPRLKIDGSGRVANATFGATLITNSQLFWNVLRPSGHYFKRVVIDPHMAKRGVFFALCCRKNQLRPSVSGTGCYFNAVTIQIIPICRREANHDGLCCSALHCHMESLFGHQKGALGIGRHCGRDGRTRKNIGQRGQRQQAYKKSGQ